MRLRTPRWLASYVPDVQPDGHLTVFLALLPDGEPLVLHDVAAQIWLSVREAARGLDDVEVVAALAALTGQHRSDIEGAVLDYLDYLVDEGLLEQAPEPT